jgi:hypothetical protein
MRMHRRGYEKVFQFRQVWDDRLPRVDDKVPEFKQIETEILWEIGVDEEVA